MVRGAPLLHQSWGGLREGGLTQPTALTMWARHWRARALLPIRENSLPDHQVAWQWAWELGWAKGTVQVIEEGRTLSGQAGGLLVGLEVSGHSHHSHLLNRTFPSLSPSWLQPAPMILWAWLPLQRISESHSPLVSVVCYQEL